MVEWMTHTTGLPAVTDADLDAVETARGVALPPALRVAMKAHVGDIPEPGVADVGSAKIPVDALFFARQGETADLSYNMWHYIETLDANLPDNAGAKLIPFTSDGSQGIFALDYRAGGEPGVVLIDLDIADEPGAITPVAPSFDAFLAGLHD